MYQTSSTLMGLYVLSAYSPAFRTRKRGLCPSNSIVDQSRQDTNVAAVRKLHDCYSIWIDNMSMCNRHSAPAGDAARAGSAQACARRACVHNASAHCEKSFSLRTLTPVFAFRGRRCAAAVAAASQHATAPDAVAFLQPAPCNRRASIAAVLAGAVAPWLFMPTYAAVAAEGSGLEIVSETVGFGKRPAQPGDLVLLHYTGYDDATGAVFDTTRGGLVRETMSMWAVQIMHALAVPVLSGRLASRLRTFLFLFSFIVSFAFIVLTIVMSVTRISPKDADK